MSPTRFQRQCTATGVALEILAVGFGRFTPGFDLWDSAFPDHLPNVERREIIPGEYALDGSQARSEAGVFDIQRAHQTLSETHLVVTENMYATGALLQRGDGYMGYSQYPTARAAIEGLGLMFWILDPGIDGELRRNRAMSELLRSAHWHDEVEDGLLRALEAEDISISESGRYGYHAGEEVPTKTNLVDALGVEYHGISMLAHAEALGRVLMQRTSGTNRRHRTEIHAQDLHLFDLFLKLLTATDAVIDRWTDYTGWSRDAYDVARTESIRKMQTSAHMPQAPT